ncbi:MAG: chemotaxis protein CheW [Gammaproteobacteria bacterium]|nr:chemotaxis protein CheW [Gammaproteobacteria bacterium]
MSVIKFQQNQAKDSACWRMYGTWSADPTCEKLKYVTHCRNCDVFENAARQSWEKQESKDKSELAVFSIEELIEKEKSAGDHSALPFRVAGNCFAVPSANIVTITDNVAVHSIPYNKNPILKGLVAINNEIYSLVNFARLLQINTAPDRTNLKRRLYKRVLVVDLGKHCIAFHVEEVFQIHRYFEKLVRDAEDGEVSIKELSNGFLGNFGQWETDCCLLNLEALQKHFEKEISGHGLR